MKLVKPKVFLVGETKIIEKGLGEYLKHLGAPKWESDAPSDAEKLIEVMGRLCYRSFEVGLNPNVTKVRKHNKEYLDNILETGHGSVLEHAFFNFIFSDVSRVFTHELVRHRAGVAISQESLRFVRLDKIGLWLPTVIRETPELMEVMVKTAKQLEEIQKDLANLSKIDESQSFDRKKKLTSAFRRAAPIGLATTIGWSANARTIRHVIEMRTNPHAEEEIRLVFGEVAEIMAKKYPNLFGDYETEMIDGLAWYKTKNKKV